jgi:hypothetical protein
VRALKILVVVMGVMILVGTVTLGVVLVKRLNGGKAPVAAAPMVLGQPEGSRIMGVAPTEGGGLAVAVQRPDGDRVLLLDLKRGGQVIGELRLR